MKADRTGAGAPDTSNGTSTGLIWITVAAFVALAFTFWVQSESMAQRNWPELKPVDHVDGMASQMSAPVSPAKMPERFFNSDRPADPFDRTVDESQWALAQAVKPNTGNGLAPSQQGNTPPLNPSTYPWPNPVNNAPASDNVRVVQSATQQAMETMVGGAVREFSSAASGAVAQTQDAVRQRIDQAKNDVANQAQQLVNRIPEPVTQILRPEMNDGRIRLPQVNVPAVKQAIQQRLPEQVAQLPNLQNAAAGLQDATAGLQALAPIGESAAHAVQSRVREVVDGATNKAQGVVENAVKNALPQSIKVPDLTGGTLKLPSVSIPKPTQAALAVRDMVSRNAVSGNAISDNLASVPSKITLPNSAAPPSPTLTERVENVADRASNFAASAVPNLRAQAQQAQIAAPKIHIPSPPAISGTPIQPELPATHTAGPSMNSVGSSTRSALPAVQAPTTVKPKLDLSNVSLPDLAVPTVQSPSISLPQVQTANVPTSPQAPRTSPSIQVPQVAAKPSTSKWQLPEFSPTNSPMSPPLQTPAVLPQVTQPQITQPQAAAQPAPQLSVPQVQTPQTQPGTTPQFSSPQVPQIQPPLTQQQTPAQVQVPASPAADGPSWQLPDPPEFQAPNLNLPQIQTPPNSPALNSPLGKSNAAPRTVSQTQVAANSINSFGTPKLPEFNAPKLLGAKDTPSTNSLAKSAVGTPMTGTPMTGAPMTGAPATAAPATAASQNLAVQNQLPQMPPQPVSPVAPTLQQSAIAQQNPGVQQTQVTQQAPSFQEPRQQAQVASAPPTAAPQAEAAGRASSWGGTASLPPQNGFVIPEQTIAQQPVVPQPTAQQPVDQQPAVGDFVAQQPQVPAYQSDVQSQEDLPAPPAATPQSQIQDSLVTRPSTPSATHVASAGDSARGEPVEVARVLAMVGNQPILAGDVLGQVNQLLQQYEGKAPKEELEQQRQLLVRQALPQLVDNKLIFLDFMKDIPLEKLPDLEKRVFDVFAETELPKLVEKSGVKTAKDLDAKLREHGSSIQKQRRLFMEKAVAQQQIQAKISFRRDVKHDELLQFYEDNINDYHVDARAKFEHLMVRFDRFESFDASGNYDPNMARNKAQSALAEMGNQVLGGAPMTEVAKRSSHGPFAEKGGLHDWTVKGALASDALDKALFRLPVGKMSQIIEDDQGLHIMRVVEREPAGTIPFGEVQDKIAETIKQRRFQKGVQEYIAKLRDTTHVRTVFDDGENGGTLIATPKVPVVR